MDTSILINIAQHDLKLWINFSMLNKKLTKVFNIQTLTERFSTVNTVGNRKEYRVAGYLHRDFRYKVSKIGWSGCRI